MVPHRMKRPGAKATPGTGAKRATGATGSRLVDERIRLLGGWRAEILTNVRRLIHEAVPDVEETCKWFKPGNPLGVPVWSHGGIICTGESYQRVVKLTFVQGASLDDPRRLFNSSLEGKTRRAIDLPEGEAIDARAFKALVKSAAALNAARLGDDTKEHPDERKVRPVRLLSGGNPQIAKADGDAPVRAYLAAIPGWKRNVGKRLDEIIVRTVPGVRKAVKWNSPFYGLEGRGWFVSFHVFTKYVKVTFFQGTQLEPVPPGGTGKDARWIDVHEHDLDEAQMARWMKQAAALPGWMSQEAPGRSTTPGRPKRSRTSS